MLEVWAGVFENDFAKINCGPPTSWKGFMRGPSQRRTQNIWPSHHIFKTKTIESKSEWSEILLKLSIWATWRVVELVNLEDWWVYTRNRNRKMCLWWMQWFYEVRWSKLRILLLFVSSPFEKEFLLFWLCFECGIRSSDCLWKISSSVGTVKP